jgi:ABC-2 type transport system ATP-binding protein
MTRRRRRVEEPDETTGAPRPPEDGDQSEGGSAEPATARPARPGIRWARPARRIRSSGLSVPALDATGLRKEYGDLVALAGVDLSVARGEKVMLVGPNGSGKTTLLRMVAGLLEPTEGDLLVDGVPVGTLDARAAVSYISDEPVLYDDLSVREHLEYVARLHATPDAARRADELVRRLGLSARVEDLPVRFSRGLRQKTALAVGLVRPFGLLLVDEPFVGLDVPGREALVPLLAEVAAAGAAVVVATHQPDFAEVADRCIGLRDGELIMDGPPSLEEIRRLVG